MLCGEAEVQWCFTQSYFPSPLESEAISAISGFLPSPVFHLLVLIVLDTPGGQDLLGLQGDGVLQLS